MAWTTIADAIFAVGKPILGITGLALRDNVTALANGDAGAPKVQPEAFATNAITDSLAPASGSTYSMIELVGAYDYILNNAAYDDLEMRRLIPLAVVCLIPGVITCSFEHRIASGSYNIFGRVCKNSSVVQEWTQNTTTYTARSVDVTVSAGDLVIFQQRSAASQNHWMRNVKVTSNNPYFAVA